MTLAAPTYNQSEYAILQKDLSGPAAMWEKMEIERQVVVLENKIRSSRNLTLEGDGFRQAIETEVFRLKKQNTLSINPRREAFRERANEVRRALRKQSRHGASYTAMVDYSVQNLALLYSGFNVDLFHQDFQFVFSEEITAEVDPTESLEELRTNLAELKKQAKWKIGQYRSYFKIIPTNWRAWKVGVNSLKQTELLEIILRMFIKDWFSRARWFSIPVSVTGVGLKTMPPIMEAAWRGLWETFGLDEIVRVRRSVIFQYRQSGAKEEEPAADDRQDQVAEIFQEQST